MRSSRIGAGWFVDFFPIRVRNGYHVVDANVSQQRLYLLVKLVEHTRAEIFPVPIVEDQNMYDFILDAGPDLGFDPAKTDAIREALGKLRPHDLRNLVQHLRCYGHKYTSFVVRPGLIPTEKTSALENRYPPSRARIPSGTWRMRRLNAVSQRMGTWRAASVHNAAPFR